GIYAVLIMENAGNVYGTARQGGTGCYGAGCGVVFELVPEGSGWVENLLYQFTGSGDGATPLGDLLMDSAGHLYGTTYGGGGKNSGVVFELSQTSSGWVEDTLYSFCSQ